MNLASTPIDCASIPIDCAERSPHTVAPHPPRIWFVEALPQGPTGKILKREIDPPQPD